MHRSLVSGYYDLVTLWVIILFSILFCFSHVINLKCLNSLPKEWLDIIFPIFKKKKKFLCVLFKLVWENWERSQICQWKYFIRIASLLQKRYTYFQTQNWCLFLSSAQWRSRDVYTVQVRVSHKAVVISWLFKLLIDMQKLNAWEKCFSFSLVFFN